MHAGTAEPVRVSPPEAVAYPLELPCLAVSSTSATEGSQWHEAVIAPKPLHGMSTTLCHKGESFSDAYAVRRPREPAIAKHTFSITRSSSWAPSSVQGVGRIRARYLTARFPNAG